MGTYEHRKENMSNIELLPCPFCGCDAPGFLKDGAHWYVECDECNASTYFGLTKLAASRWWNCQTKDKWVSVEDRLPDKDGAYLVIRNGGIKGWVGLFELCSECEMYGRWYWPRANGKRDEQMFAVTHWMPLPDSPTTVCGHPVEVSEDMPEDTIVITDGKYRVEITNIGEAEK